LPSSPISGVGDVFMANPYGLTIFKMTPEMASQTAILAKIKGYTMGF